MLHRRSASSTHPLVDQLGALTLLDAAPVAILVTDGAGQIVHRNQAAAALGAEVSTRRGGAILDALRRALVTTVGQERSYPYHEVVEVTEHGTHAEAEVWIQRVGGAYVVSWDDATDRHDAARAARALAADLSASSAQLAGLGDTMSRTAAEVAERTAGVTAEAEQMAASIREAASAAARAASGTGTAVGSAELASQRLAKLADSSDRIGAVSKLIAAVAEQTNLLALNATIEAARAGAAGKGFAVVAGEVKELAGRTRAATAEITEMISAIQVDTAEATSAIAEILRLIRDIGEQQDAVAEAVERQSDAARNVTGGVGAVAATATTSAAAVAELRSSAEAVAGTARRLDEVVAV